MKTMACKRMRMELYRIDICDALDRIIEYNFPIHTITPYQDNDLRTAQAIEDYSVRYHDDRDLVIFCEDVYFYVHRSVMVDYSCYFDRMLFGSMSESRSFSVRLYEVNAGALAHIIKIIYSIKFAMTQDLAQRIYVLANYFCMETIRRKCMLYLESHIDTENVVRVLRFAASISAGKLYELAGLFILSHRTNMSRDDPDEFYSLTYDELTRFLSHDYLQVKSEEEVLMLALKWVTRDPLRRIRQLYKLSTNIRFKWILQALSRRAMSECARLFPNWFHKHLLLNVLNRVRQRQIEFYVNVAGFGRLAPRVPKNCIVVLGGWSNFEGDAVGFESYDAFTGRWYEDPSQPDVMNLAYHGCCVIDNDIYVVGGYDGVKYYDCIRRFNTVTQVWTHLKDMDEVLCYITVSALGQDIYVIGGFNGEHRLRDVLKYSVVSNKWTIVASMSVPRSDSSLCTLKGEIYVAGGYDGIVCHRSCEVYNPVTDQWTRVVDMSLRRSGLSIVSNDRYIFAIGGYDGSVSLSTNERYCPWKCEWQPMPPMLISRTNFACEIMNGNIYVVGGYGGYTCLNKCERYDIRRKTWHRLSATATTKASGCLCLISGIKNIADYTYSGNTGTGTSQRHVVSFPLPDDVSTTYRHANL